MKKMITIILTSTCILVVIIVSVVKDFQNGINDKGFDDPISFSIDAAKKKNVYLKEATIQPESSELEGIKIEFDSSWIERRVKTIPYYLWWKQTLNRPGYRLVIRCRGDSDCLGKHGFFLQKAGEGHSFGMHGLSIYEEDLKEADYQKGIAVIYLVKDWHAPRKNPITVSWSK